MEARILKVVDKFRAIFEKMGIDYEVMRKILYLKLMMDGRRVPTILSNNNTTKDNENKSKNMFISSLWIYLLMGVILIPFIIMKNNYIYQMSIVFGVVMFMVMTSLISDFSSIILDIRDKSIIGTRPVGHKTLSMAKTLHIMIYMLFLTAALTGPALIASLFTQGPLFFLLFLIFLILLDMFCIILTTFVYFFILRFFDGEKLKDIINYVQIILSIVVLVGYQMIGRVFNIVGVNIVYKPAWWQFVVIPVWFSAPFQMLQKTEVNIYFLVFSALAILIPVITMLVYVKLIPLFEKNLQKLGNYSAKNKVKEKQEGLLARLFCKKGEERIFFHFASNMMRNERSFKLKVYPTIGFSLVFPFIFMFQMISEDGLKAFTQGKTYLFIYFCGLMLPSLIMMIGFSESYKAAWIYKALPLSSMKPVFQGTMKAFIIRLFIPVYCIEAVIFTILYGIRIIPDLFVVLLSMIILCIFYFIALDKVPPFSKSFNTTQQANFGTSLMLMLLMGIMVGIHYVFTLFTYGIFIYLCLLIIIGIILWEKAFDVTLDQLK